jgi:telomerase reverse transcriptase
LFRLKPNLLSYEQQQTEATLNDMLDKTFTNNFDLLRHNELPDLRKIYAEMLGKLRRVFSYFKKDQRSQWSEFSSLLADTCPMPKNYRTLSLLAHSFHKNTADQNTWAFNELYSNSLPYHKVSHILISTVRILMPKTLLSEANSLILFESIDEFVRMKRFENIKLEDIVYRMDMFKVPWLCPHYNHKFHKQIMSRRRKVVALVILFLYNQLIVPIVQYNFYVTDYHKEGNKLFYYSKPIWTLIAHLAITMFSQNNLQPVQFIDNSMSYPQGKLRIMPKKDSFRPIITFNRKAGIDKERANLNQLLQDTQLVLRNLKEIVGVKFGYCVFDNRHISRKYDAFVKKWREQGCPELSFFTLDIMKCYDSISPSKLLDMIKDTPLIEDIYLIIKYQRMYRNKRPLGGQKSL